MGKTIEVNLPLANLTDPNIKVADQTSIVSVSGTVSELSASFSKEELDALLNMDGCTGIRLYPAVNNDELIMIAIGTKTNTNTNPDTNPNRDDDLVGPDYFCLANNASGTVTINGATVVEGVQRIPTGIGSSLVIADGSGTDIVNVLNDIRQLENSASPTGLKVLFDQTYFKNKDFDSILFEVVDLKFTDTNDLKRSINGQFQLGTNVSSEISLLPCPPNCGGVYAPSKLITDSK